MKQLIAVSLIALGLLAQGGCASTGRQQGPGPASPAAMIDAVTLGTSSKADVQARLGAADAKVKFDSGYEVWAYQFASSGSLLANISTMFQQLGTSTALPGMTEVVILFAPSGVASKIRLRQAPAAVKP